MQISLLIKKLLVLVPKVFKAKNEARSLTYPGASKSLQFRELVDTMWLLEDFSPNVLLCEELGGEFS